MSMEIRPMPGQPGLFREGLGSTSWTSTYAGPMFKAPFGGRRRRNGLGAIALPPEFISAPMPEHLSQEDIPTGKVPGVAFTLFLFTPGPLVQQAQLDGVFRNMFAQLGYDVSSSSIGAEPITFSWTYAESDKSWEAKIATGPKALIGKGGWKVVYDAPTAQDLQGLPAAVQKYTLVARPKNGVLTPAMITSLIAASRTARAEVSKTTNLPTELYLHVKGVPGVAGPVAPTESKLGGIGAVVGLITVGWMSYLALRGKTV